MGKERQRHAKSLEIAQEEVLTCIGMCIYNRLKRIQQCVKEEENACQVLGAVAVYALCRSFDMAVENKRGYNLELIYDEISRDEKIKEAKKEQKKLKKRKKKNEKKMVHEEEGSGGCESELVSTCSADENHADYEDYEEGHSEHESHDEDDDMEEKIVMCDGTIIDVVAPNSQGCKKNTSTSCGAGGGGGCGNNNNSKNAQNHENHQPNNNNNNKNISQQHSTATQNTLTPQSTNNNHQNCTNEDAVSVTSCHSCNEVDGPCTQRSVDAGYESHHDSGSCCLSNTSNQTSSRTSSIASSPEGSEVACSDVCCDSVNCGNGQANRSNRRNTNCNGNGERNGCNEDSGLVFVLQSMLLVSFNSFLVFSVDSG